MLVGVAPNAITGNPQKAEVLDFTHPMYNILPCDCPLNKNGGFIKRVLLDKKITLNNHGVMVNNNTQNPDSFIGYAKEFKQYIRYPHKIRYMDTTAESGSPINDTQYPIYVLLMTDMALNQSSPSPTTAQIGWVTGYTQGWFKDA